MLASALASAVLASSIACSATSAPGESQSDREDHSPIPWILSGEFEPVDEVILGWDDDFHQFYRDTMMALAGHSRISLIVDPSFDRGAAEAVIADVKSSVVHGYVDDIDIVDLEIDSLWLRDFGPLVTSQGGRRQVSDLQYWAKGADDRLAARMATDWLSLETTEIALELEGGNLQADGVGNCLTSTSVLLANPDRNEASIRQILEDNFGCTNIEILPPLPGEPTEHVDMFLTFSAPHELIVGSYDADDDPTLREHLDWIAVYLAERGFLVRRVPMPDQWDELYRTYTNSLAVNGVVLVPYYEDETRNLEEAIRVYQEAYPEREIIPVESNVLIKLNGAIHCAAITIPK